MSFRSKLFLAMMAVVVGVTGATLLVAQDRLAMAYRRLFEQQFASQQALERVRLEARLSGLQEKTLRFGRLVRLQALLRRLNDAVDEKNAGDLKETTEKLYQTAEDDFRDVLNASNADPGARLAVLFRLLGSNGQVLPPPPGIDAGRLKAESEQLLARQLLSPFRSGSGGVRSSLGHLAVDAAGGRRRAIEVVFTPFEDNRERTLLGALVVGFASPESEPPRPGEETGSRAPPGTAGGLWLGGEFYSSCLDAATREAVAAELRTRAAESVKTGQFETMINGVPHRVMFAELLPDSIFPAAHQVTVFSLRELRAEQRALRWRILGYGALALLAALASSWVLASGLSVPIRELVAATGEVQRGNLAVTVPVRGANEIARLAAAFNQMTAGLALKEKYRGLLNLVADPKIADELVNGHVTLGGEEREVSVLFCDIRGFTALTQGMQPVEVVHLLNEHFTPLTRVVYDHHGVVDKFVGDLIMAVFGAPKTYGLDAWNAVSCARRMIEARDRLNASSRYRIQMGIGIASGPALAGCMGSADRLNYTVLGARVNLASRLCGQAGRMEVVIDQTTRERLGGRVTVEALPEVKLKGFSDSVRPFKVLALEAPALPTAPTNAPSAPKELVT